VARRRTSPIIIGGEPIELAKLTKGLTTRAMKARMLDEAAHYDQLSADADRAAQDGAGL
jgi:hypothetical protein